MVAYSGGKYLRGPQSTGLLLGTSEWIAAAFPNAAPHHAVARGMKVSKEEVCGLVAAVELLVERDAAGEKRRWHDDLQEIADRVLPLGGIEAEIKRPASDVDGTPLLQLRWHHSGIVLHPLELRELLLQGEPAVMLDDRGADEASLLINPFNLQPGEAAIVGARVAASLEAARHRTAVSVTERQADIGGDWAAEVSYVGRTTPHRLQLVQRGAQISGWHEASTGRSEVAGEVRGQQVEISSLIRLEGTHLAFRFRGRVSVAGMAGRVEIGTHGQSAPGPLNQREFGDAEWRAVRAAARQ
jgi:L-seryl-tRNA(Ser) seleniumtransferase